MGGAEVHNHRVLINEIHDVFLFLHSWFVGFNRIEEILQLFLPAGCIFDELNTGFLCSLQMAANRSRRVRHASVGV